jgi:hypothetical protein
LDTGSLLLILSIAILTGLYVARPFFSETLSNDSDDPSNDMLSFQELALLDLLEKKDRIFTELQELDADFSMGNVQTDAYPQLRDELKFKAAEILKRVEELETSIQASGEGEFEAVEAIPQKAMPENRMDAIEELIVARRRSRNEKSAGFCPRCGKVIQKSDVYCPGCGSKVA